MKKLVIAIDGPAGAGKSTIAQKVAIALGYIYIDTGAMYRAVTLKFFESGRDFSPEAATASAASANITFARENGLNRVFLEGRDITDSIRSHEVTGQVSAVSAVPGVRAALVELQRQMGKCGGVVMDGRDIGTVVFPQADVKIYLTAGLAERTARRAAELRGKGLSVDEEKLSAEIAARDKFDSERAIGPLRCAEDAVYLDTSAMSITETVEQIIGLCGEK